jgi:hypothetical protein
MNLWKDAKFQFDELIAFASLIRLRNAYWACAGGFFAVLLAKCLGF